MPTSKVRIRRITELLVSGTTTSIAVRSLVDSRNPALTAGKHYQIELFEGNGEPCFVDDQGIPIPLRDDMNLDVFEDIASELVKLGKDLPAPPPDIGQLLSNLAINRKSMDYEIARKALAAKITGTMNRLIKEATSFEPNDILATNMHDNEPEEAVYLSIVVRPLDTFESYRAQELSHSAEVCDLLVISATPDGFALQIASSWMFRKIGTLSDWGIDNLDPAIGERFIKLTK